MDLHHSLTGKKWRTNGMSRHAISELVLSLARERGIDLTKKPSFDALADPMTLGDMKKVLARVHSAIDEEETIGIIGDYDADGITGTAQMIRFCKRHGLPHHAILPHRQKHGYGVKKAFVDELKSKKVTLLITIDTGIAYPAEIKHARSLGMDVIIMDHHECTGGLPDATILHPTANEKHANPHLCGSGVVFTFIRAFENDNWEHKEIDVSLAAIGTVADVVPLKYENRMIVQLGLLALNHGTNHPVFDLAQSIGKTKGDISSMDIGFRIAPRINAAGRIDDPQLSLKALLEGGEVIDTLHKINTERQEATRQMLASVEEISDPRAPLIAAVSEEFHPGIIGLLAGRLTEQFGRPSCIGAEINGQVTCSLRSIPEYNISEALNRCNEYLASFGGHAAAGGCTLDESDWEQFSQSLISDASDVLAGIDLVPSIPIDAEIDLDELNIETIKEFARLEPFGEGNPEPRFLIRNTKLTFPRAVGKEDAHLQCSLGNVKAIGFRLGHLANALPECCDIVCRLGIDTWKERERVQVFIEDLRAHVLDKEQLKKDLCEGASIYDKEDREWAES